MAADAAAVPVSVLLDRLTSASVPSDAEDSLAALLFSVRHPTEGNDNASSIAQNGEAMAALCSLIGAGRLSRDGLEVENGPALSCELTQGMIDGSKEGKARTSLIKALLDPPAGPDAHGDAPRLIDALLDLLCPSDAADAARNSAYSRILSVGVLRSLVSSSPSLSQSKLLAAPDGLNRLVDLLDPSTPEEVRNEGVLLATDLATASGGAARLIIFSEGYERALTIAADAEGGLGGTAGLGVVADCVRLCLELTRRDGMGAEVLLGSGGMLEKVAGLLDLRLGRKFRVPEVEETGGGEGGADDLDDIMKGDDAKSKSSEPPSVAVPYLTEAESEVVSLTLDLIDALLLGEDDGTDPFSPTAEEPAVLKRRGRQARIAKHDKLSRLLLDLALFAHPPPGARYVCASPTSEVQCRALSVLANLGRDAGEDVVKELSTKRGVYLPIIGLLERVMYLVCTGGGPMVPPKPAKGGKTSTQNMFTDRMDVSSHALSVFRSTFSAQEAQLMMLHTISPPMDMDDEISGEPRPPPVTEVRKLVNTLANNLHFLAGLPANADGAEEANKTAQEKRDEREGLERCVVATVGAAGALGVFLTNGAGDTSREMLLRVPVSVMPSAPPPPAAGGGAPPPPPQPTETNLMECAVHYLENTTSSDATHTGYDPSVAMALLRLLSEWIPGAQPVVYSLLANPGSVSLGMMLQAPPAGSTIGTSSSDREGASEEDAAEAKAKAKGARKAVQALTALLLGLCMENLEPDDEAGGWTRSGLMGLVSAGIGISKFTSSLEGLSKSPMSEGGGAPWTRSELEEAAFLGWCRENVRVVRKRAVQELTTSAGGSMGDSDSDSDGEGDPSNPAAEGGGDSKSMARLLARQTSELDSLRSQLEEAQETVSTQTTQLKSLKRRMESNPTELDRILDEKDGRIRELERENAALTASAGDKNAEVESSLEAKDAEVARAQEETRQAQEEAAEERDALRTEMEGLSSAYTNLEGEYNRLGGGSAGGEATTEGASSSGDAASQQHVQSLQSENSKLRNDIRAANEWMQQAVGRMDGLTRTNAELEGQVNTLQASSAAMEGGAPTAGDFGAAAEAAARAAAVESQLSNSQSECDSLRTELDATRSELSQTQEEVRSLQAAHTDKDADSAAKHQVLANLQAERDVIVEEKEAEMARLRGSHDTALERLRTELASVREDAAGARGELEGALREQDGEIRKKSDEIAALECRLGEMEAELEQHKEAAAAAPAAGMEPRNDEAAVAKLEEELAALNAKNKAAQDWMKNAVAHHQTLAAEVASLKEQKSASDRELESLKEQNRTLEAGAEEAAAAHEQRAREAMEKRSESELRLEEVERGVAAERSDAEALRVDLKMARDEADALRVNLDECRMEAEEGAARTDETRRVEREKAEAEATGRIQGLEEQIESLKERLDIAEDTASGLQEVKDRLQSKEREVEELSSAAGRIQELEEEIESLQERLNIAEDTASGLQEVKEQLQAKEREVEELPALRLQVEEKEREIDELLKKHSEDETEANRLAAQLKSFNQESSALQQNLATVRGKFSGQVESQDEEIKRLEGEVRRLEEERDAASSATEALKGRLAEFQAWTQSAQKRIGEVEGERDALEAKVADLVLAEDVVRQEAEAAKDELELERKEAEKNTEALKKEKADAEEFMVREKEELQAKVSQLETDSGFLASAKAELSAQVERLTLLEKTAAEESAARLAALTAESEEKEKKLTEAEEQLFEKESSLADVEGELAAATQELEEMRGQSEEAVGQWQARAEELEAKVGEHEGDLETLRAQIQQQESEATEVIAQWETRCTQLENDLSEVEESAADREELQKLQEELAQLRSNAEEKERRVTELQKRLVEKESALADAEGEKSALAKEMDELRGRSEEVVTQHKEEQSKLQEELAQLRAGGEEKEQRMTELEEQLFEKESSLADAEGERSALAKETEELRSRSELVVTQHKEEHSKLQEELAQLRSGVEEKERRLTEVEEQLFEKESSLADAEGDLSALTKEMDELRGQSEEVVGQWQERTEELETKVTELEGSLETLQSQMQQQESEATDAISQWEGQCSQLEKDMSEAAEALQAQMQQQESEVTEAISQWEERCAQLERDASEAAEKGGEAKLVPLQDRISSLEHELEAKKTSLDEVLERLSVERKSKAVDEKAWLEAELKLKQEVEGAKKSIEEQQGVIANMNEQLGGRETAIAGLEQQVKVLTTELTETREQSEEVVNQWKERSDQLEANVAEMESALVEQQTEAATVIEQWEERVTELENQVEESGWEGEKVVALTRGIEACKDSEQKMKKDLDTALDQIKSMKQRLEEAMAEKAKYETKTQEAAGNLATKELELSAAEESVEQWRGRSEQLGSTVAELEEALQSQSEEATLAIEQWESQCNELASQAEELEKQVARSGAEGERVVELNQRIESLKESEKTNDAALKEVRAQVESMQLELNKANSQCKELSNEKSHIEAAMKSRAEEASAIIEAKKDELSSVDTRVAELSYQLDTERNTLVQEHEAKKQVEMELAKLVDRSTAIEKELTDVKESVFEFEGATLELKKQLAAERSEKDALSKNMSSKQVEELQKSKQELESTIETERRQSEETSRSLEGEKRVSAELKTHIRELQEELHEANEALQSRITDEVSTRAAEMATEALRAQLNEVRLELNETSEALESESHLRLSAEDDNRKLRLALSEKVPEELAESYIKNLSLKGTEKSLKLERLEVEELRKSLEKVMEELNASRVSGRDAEERATSARLLSSTAEMEALGLRSNIALLQQTIEEMKSTEGNTRHSLEYHIIALEEDRDILTRSHSQEVEDIKAELDKVIMEKERVSHSLAESEKANTALVYATTAQAEHGDGSATELAQLRLERAQLLAAATEVGSRTERRIREAVAASAASIEAELIMEKELRKAAESLVEDAHAEMEGMKARTVRGARPSPTKARQDREKLIDLEDKLQQHEGDISKLNSEKRELKNKLDKSESNARATVIKLTEKCRLAETKAREIEREGRFEAAVAAEISRLRDEYTNPADEDEPKSPSALVISNGAGASSEGMSAEGVHDFVLELRSAIKDERQLYHELLSEHEDLLALVAQQDVENSSLTSALVGVGGQLAVDEALQEAESKAVKDFGTYIRLR